MGKIPALIIITTITFTMVYSLSISAISAVDQGRPSNGSKCTDLPDEGDIIDRVECCSKEYEYDENKGEYVLVNQCKMCGSNKNTLEPTCTDYKKQQFLQSGAEDIENSAGVIIDRGTSGKNSDATNQVKASKTLDKIQPRVVSFTPANGTIRVQLLPSISATFSESMQASTVSNSTFQVKDSVGNIVPGIVTKEPLNPPNVFVFKPSSQLASSKLYSATITTGVKDLAGNPLASTTKWSFTTSGNQASKGTFQPPKDTAGIQLPPDTSEPSGDTIPPKVMSVMPTNGATGVAVSSSIMVTFSERVQPSTVSTATFKLATIVISTQPGIIGTLPDPIVVNVPGIVTLSTDGKTATFRPAQALWSEKTYSYTLTGVRDLSGNPLTPSPNLQGSFTTGST